MKRKNLNALIAGSVACVGIVASVSSAFALYYKTVQDKSIDISIGTSSDAALSISDPVRKQDAALRLNPDQDITYDFTLAGTTNGGYTQDVIVGQFTMEITSTNASLLSNIDVTGLVDYAEGSYFAAEQSALVFTTADDGSSISISRPVAVHVGTGNTAHFTLSMKDTVTNETFLTLAEAPISVNMSFTVPTAEQFSSARVVGDLDSWQWKLDIDKAVMVPDIDAVLNDGYQWKWVADTDYHHDGAENEFKVIHNDTWYTGADMGEANMKAVVKQGDTIYLNKNNVVYYAPKA